MQSDNRFFDDLAKMADGAMSVATGAREEAERLFRQRVERLMNDQGWVTREEFEAVRDMAARARAEQESLTARVAALEAAAKSPPAKAGPKAGTKATTKAGPKATAKPGRARKPATRG